MREKDGERMTDGRMAEGMNKQMKEARKEGRELYTLSI